ncbi:MAG: DMT family transporter [Rhodoferax sp.]|uniref:DMT family transporter n=1 Tax=Rhodoferax sp. TaxID=50421 RepID=UPI001400226E|nr:DMT family transporter [Rhodoferax sp.]NDP37205.1 DMT family transporter [Rhodoferax sp.]
MKKHPGASAVLAALAAAALFGASTPLAKQFVGDMSALLLAGLLYLGSGVGLLGLRVLRDRAWCNPGLAPREWPWLLGAIGCGGVIGPTLLMLGLAATGAATASLLLNLEGVLTALLAWFIFKENAGRRVVVGMALVVAGGLLLSWPGAVTGTSAGGMGAAFIVGACLCWALDNNLTRQVANSDALFIAGLKGIIAAVVNIGLALALGQSLPAWRVVGPVLLIGFLGYGISLALFVLALRGLGAARTGAYFGAAPFMGAAIAIGVFGESTSPLFWGAGLFMAAGLWLHLTERHSHPHWHGTLQHSHPHFPDMDHRHDHP